MILDYHVEFHVEMMIGDAIKAERKKTDAKIAKAVKAERARIARMVQLDESEYELPRYLLRKLRRDITVVEFLRALKRVHDASFCTPYS